MSAALAVKADPVAVRRAYALAAARVALIRARLLVCEIEDAAVALDGWLIDPDAVLTWLGDLDPTPPAPDDNWGEGWREAAIEYHRLRGDRVSLVNPDPDRKRATPEVTVEAVLHCARTRGLAALKEPKNIERLSRCDAAAKAEIDRRIAKLNGGAPHD
jgi:hypothetical protein